MGKLTDEQKTNLPKELIAKAMQCETPEQLVELAKSEGIELTLEEAQAYLAKMDDFELDSQQLQKVAGGWCSDCKLYTKGKIYRSIFAMARSLILIS
ncbi:MAG: hypothetical protein SR3Q1_03285 [Quinella sp. 3Q1]|nr:hypothetical protein [Quinella sp. 3Q1]MBR6888131.1 hypothetical protein [Selenomonadaceae bacterium]